MIEVYHRKNPDFITHGKFPEDYIRVASVDTGFLNDAKSLDIAFGLTNNSDNIPSWTKNNLVFTTKGLRINGCRSTSVGDIIIQDDGEKYVVKGVGFMKYEFLQGNKHTCI